MKKWSICRIILCTFIVIIIFSITIGNILWEQSGVGRNYCNNIYNKLLYTLKKKLVMEIPLPTGIYNQGIKKSMAIYVLGGDQGSLTSRFQKAASLYHQGFSKNILILSRTGITEFSRKLGRNLTNNEWAIRELERLNVKKEDIEPVFVKKTLLGTMSEANDLSNIVNKKGLNGVILVTSDYHTRRVFTAFSRYASNRNIELYVYGSNDTADLQILLSEYIKLLFYKTISLSGYMERRGRIANEANDIFLLKLNRSA